MKNAYFGLLGHPLTWSVFDYIYFFFVSYYCFLSSRWDMPYKLPDCFDVSRINKPEFSSATDKKLTFPLERKTNTMPSSSIINKNQKNISNQKQKIIYQTNH